MDCSIIVPPHLYVTGNYMYGSDQVTRNNWSGISLHSGASTDVIKSDTRFVPEGYERTTLLSMHSAETAFSKVLSFAGASYKKDAIDQRIAYETEQGVYTYNGSNGSTGGLIDTQGDVGGWPEYASLNPLTDSDQDGMPDVWETANGLNPQDATDAAAYTLDSNQWYTNIEVYANSLVEDLVKAQTADAIEGIDEYISADSAERILEGDWDILVDAIDTIGNKAVIDKAALDRGLPVYASMGAAMHFDPSAVRIATLKKTDTCPLASQLRRQMRDVDTSGMICVYSAEPVTAKTEDRDEHGKSVLGSLSTIPAIFGMTLASLVIRRITGY
jgi:hypothetical protein